MIVAMVFAHVWGVLELILLGSFARTVRIRTALMGVAAGFYASAAVAVLLEFAWTRLAAGITGVPVGDVIQTASYTTDPFIEELVKVLPLALLLLWVRVIRLQWSITDCALVGGALGSGFGLAEDLYRFSAAPADAVWTGLGFVLRTNFATVVTVPGPWITVTSWLPGGVVRNRLFSFFARAPHTIDPHTVWSTIGGLAVGLCLKPCGSIGRRVGIALLLFAGIDHALCNAAVHASPHSVVVGLSTALQSLSWFLPLAALAVAWWLDRQRRSSDTIAEFTLAAEKTSSPTILGTLRTGLDRFPWSAFGVDALVRIRRAYAAAQAESGACLDPLRARIVALRDRIDWAVAQPMSFVSGFGRTRAAFLAKLRQPSIRGCLVLIAPAVLCFVVGGFPATASLQEALLSRPAWFVIRLMSAIALAWTAWNLIFGLRLWVQVSRWPLADIPAMFVLQLISGAGVLAVGGYVLFLSIIRSSPYIHVISNTHIIDALTNLPAGQGQFLAFLGPLLSTTGGFLLSDSGSTGDQPDTPAEPAYSGQGGAPGETGQEGGTQGESEPEPYEVPDAKLLRPSAQPSYEEANPPSYLNPVSEWDLERWQEEDGEEAEAPRGSVSPEYKEMWERLHGRASSTQWGDEVPETPEVGTGPGETPPMAMLPRPYGPLLDYAPPPPWWLP